LPSKRVSRTFDPENSSIDAFDIELGAQVRARWQLGQWRGIPISLHWTVFIGIPWFLWQTRSLADTAIAFFAFFFLLLAHELGHAAVALWRRVEVDHIQLFFLHGYCAHEPPDYELDDVLIAWGGVAAQLVVFVIALGADVLLATFSPVARVLASPLLLVLIGTNVFIMIVNLIPLAPLDGAKAWRILPILAEWAKGTSWAHKWRRRSAARQTARTRKLEAESERIAADIIEKLKKRKSDV
jgi:Zn-dependent protease